MKGEAKEREGKTLRKIIQAEEKSLRNRALEEVLDGWSPDQLLAEARDLEDFRHEVSNLYEKVRALFFLFAIHRFYLPGQKEVPARGRIPYDGFSLSLERRFEEAVEKFLLAQEEQGPNEALSSALANAYHNLAFQSLADQVRYSVKAARGNRWMFRMGHPMDHPLRWKKDLWTGAGEEVPYPVVCERTAVRMDLTHSAWSDIFFLGMDFPEGARVLNVSIDLAVLGRDRQPEPPVRAFLRVIDEPVIRLSSIDLGVQADLHSLDEVFDFARDYLGLLKAAVIASGVVPPGLEGSGQELAELLGRLIEPGKGFELVSSVNNIPKGSRLAVSTNLLGSLIAVLMRATGQTSRLSGPLSERERRVVAARAILGEWLGGSGGGWQDSGGVWPGIKLIEGEEAREGDPEFGISRGCLLPRHTIIDTKMVSKTARRKLQDSLILVHGGMAQNVGPILEMVTEKYLLRTGGEWQARQEALAVLERIREALAGGDMASLGRETTFNFRGPLQKIIPWASNLYTEQLIEEMEKALGEDFWGFWMLGGMSGGGMGFMVAPRRKKEAGELLLAIMQRLKKRLEKALPFAMDPVVYDFSINEEGTASAVREGSELPFPPAYYARVMPDLLRREVKSLRPRERTELEAFGRACREKPEFRVLMDDLFANLLPGWKEEERKDDSLEDLLRKNGFDPVAHEKISRDYRNGRIGVAQNRLGTATRLEDVEDGDVVPPEHWETGAFTKRGEALITEGKVAVLTLAAGVGSRWSQGAGVVKALHPFARLAGRHRTFLETHLAKSRRTGKRLGRYMPHLISTSYLTHGAIARHLEEVEGYGYEGCWRLSPGRAIGLRLIPTLRDLRFTWEEVAQQRLDEQKQKMLESVRAALAEWVRTRGEGEDYRDNLPGQCLHPVGHWYEVPNLLRNGVLADLLEKQPELQYLMVHNIDTLGADMDPSLLGWFAQSGSALAYEVTPRRLEDRGGGLAKVGSRVRLVEGLAMPSEEDELRLSYYNTNTCWIDLKAFLNLCGLGRSDLRNEEKVTQSIRRLGEKMPTYITLKDVKKRWGQGQEDIFPVAQFEKLWGDMTILSDLPVAFPVVDRQRGQQLKDQAQLDGWLRDGSAAHVERLAEWD